MVHSARVALVSDDLMFSSRLRAALAPGGVTVMTSSGDPPAPAEIVFVDLNREPERRLGVIGRLRAARPQATIIGFCHHGDRGLRIQAMRSGANQVVTNGAVPATALRVVAAGSQPSRP